MTPPASVNDEFAARQETGAEPRRRSGFDRDEYVRDLLERDSSVYGGAPNSETAQVYTGDDETEASEAPDTDSENPSPAEADSATTPPDDAERTEDHHGKATDAEDGRQPPELGFFGRAKVLLTTPFTKLGDPGAGDGLFGDVPESEAESGPPVANIPSLTPDEEAGLREAGFETPLDVWQADHEALTETAGISPEHTDTISQRAATIIDPTDIPHLALPEPDADDDDAEDTETDTEDTETKSPHESSQERNTVSEERVTEDETNGGRVDKSDTDTTSEETTDTGFVGRAAAIVTGEAFQPSTDESDPHPDLELTDIPPVMRKRATILADAGFETPRDVWEADQEALGRLDEFDTGLAETVHREAGMLVDPEAVSAESSTPGGPAPDTETTDDEPSASSDSDFSSDSDTQPEPETTTETPTENTTTTEPKTETETEPAVTETDTETDIVTDTSIDRYLAR